MRKWKTISDSEYAWEQEALDFIRRGLEKSGRTWYHAWSCFEFPDTNSRFWESDLLINTPKGCFLVEIKSRPGTVRGNHHTWTWTTSDGRVLPYDNPLRVTTHKAKILGSKLRGSDAARSNSRKLFVQPLIFLSAPGLKNELNSAGVYTRANIIDALTTDPTDFDFHAPPVSRTEAMALARRVEKSDIRRALNYDMVGNYRLDTRLSENDVCQEWLAVHTKFPDAWRRVRIYPRPVEAGGDRQRIEKAALHEYKLLHQMEHPNILRAMDYDDENRRGPAVIYEHAADALPLDEWLHRRSSDLDISHRLEIIRQIAETLSYAHRHRLTHRTLGPHAVLVSEPEQGQFRVRIHHWQQGHLEREGTSHSSTGSLLDPNTPAHEVARCYQYPVHGTEEGNHIRRDIFSLGAVSFLILTDKPPAESPAELRQILKRNGSLLLTDVMDNPPSDLDLLITYATEVKAKPFVSVNEFLDNLNQVEETLTTPAQTFKSPAEIKENMVLAGRHKVLRRLGRGASSFVFLVETDGAKKVLKLAAGHEHNDKLKSEHDLLKRLRHQNIVACEGMVSIEQHVGLFLDYLEDGSLDDYYGREGTLDPRELNELGDQLFAALHHLEQEGCHHRDIKPANMGLTRAAGTADHRLVLFDFSLAGVDLNKTQVGTRAYLDPFLQDRSAFDAYGDRYAAAMTLYELAAGALPVWGDGQTDPIILDCDITVDGDRFDINLRDQLTAFFQRAFKRECARRFASARHMQQAWRHVFEPGHIDKTVERTQKDAAGWHSRLANVSLNTPLQELGLSTRATNQLLAEGAQTAADLLNLGIAGFRDRRGVGLKTFAELSQAHEYLNNRFPDYQRRDDQNAGIDKVFRYFKGALSKIKQPEQDMLRELLGLDNGHSQLGWPTMNQVADTHSADRAAFRQFLTNLRKERWRKVTALDTMAEAVKAILIEQGGILADEELVQHLLDRFGSHQTEPARRAWARSAAHACFLYTTLGPKTKALEWREHHAAKPESGPQPPVLICADFDPAFPEELDGLGMERAAYARELGKLASNLAAKDPLLSPSGALEQLRTLPRPAGVEALPAIRLTRLAVAATRDADLSSQLEIYPIGMAPDRALKLSTGVIPADGRFKPEKLIRSVKSRYPRACPLPQHPKLGKWLEQQGIHVDYDHETQSYEPKPEPAAGFSSAKPSSSANYAPGPARETEQQDDILRFDQRLSHLVRDGGFLALIFSPRYHTGVVQRLEQTTGLTIVSFEKLLFDRLDVLLKQYQYPWQTLLKADQEGQAGPHWRNLCVQMSNAATDVVNQLNDSSQSMALTQLGLLARYGRVDLLSELLSRTGRAGGPHMCVPLLVGGHTHEGPTLAGQGLPFEPHQYAKPPIAWLHACRQDSNGELP